MSKEVVLRKSGNSLIFTAPSSLNNNVGKKYSVSKRDDGTIIYSPIKHKNIFDSPEWRNYDFQSDLHNDPELVESKPVGKENLE